MANKPKAQAATQARKVKKVASSRGLTAQLYENNAPGRDLDIYAGGTRIHELKSRKNLNVHATLANTIHRWPGLPAAVIWERLSRKGDNVRRTADGPMIAAMTVDDYMDLLAVSAAADELVNAWLMGQGLDDLLENLKNALTGDRE